MDKNYSFYRGYLDRIQAVDGEPGLLAATEVVQAVCNAGFQRNGFSMKSYPSSPHYYYKFAKPPKEGMFLLRAVKKTDMTTQDILIDTRLYPCFVMIEEQADWQDGPEEVVDTVELRINIGAEIFNWHINLQELRTNKTQHLKEFMSALSYMEDIEDNMHEKHNSSVQIGQLILKVNGNNYYNGNTEMEEPTDATGETQPEDNDTGTLCSIIRKIHEENVLKKMGDWGLLMTAINQTDGLPYFDTPNSFITYLSDSQQLDGIELPSESSISKMVRKMRGMFPDWTFTDTSDVMEVNRRINVGRRLVSAARAAHLI